MASAAILLAPAQRPTRRDKARYQVWRDHVESVLDYRGGYRKLKTLDRGGHLGYLANRGASHEFDLGAYPHRDEISYLLSLFTIAIYPTPLQEQFHQHLGLEPLREAQVFVPDHTWTAEPFVDFPFMAGIDVMADLAAWYNQAQSDGLIFRANAAGTWQIRQFQAGQEVTQPIPALPGGQVQETGQLNRAAQQLDLRAIFAPLGLPDLLNPGHCPESSHGLRNGPDKIEEWVYQTAHNSLENLPPPLPIYSLREMIQHFPGVLKVKLPEVTYTEAETAQLRPLEEKAKAAQTAEEARKYLDAIAPIQRAALERALEQDLVKRAVTIRITLPQADNDFLVALLEDLRSDSVLEYALHWRTDRVIWGFLDPKNMPGTFVRPAMLVRTLGDLPLGTQLAISTSQARIAYEIAPQCPTRKNITG